MKNKILLLLSAFCFLLFFAGCSTTTFVRPDGTRLHNVRCFWTTENLEGSISTNGLTVKLSRSSANNQAIAAAAEGVARGLAAGAKP